MLIQIEKNGAIPHTTDTYVLLYSSFWQSREDETHVTHFFLGEWHELTMQKDDKVEIWWEKEVD